MVIERIDAEILEAASMLHDVFAGNAAPAIDRRIAWSLDCARVDDAMHWLDVRETIFGQPL